MMIDALFGDDPTLALRALERAHQLTRGLLDRMGLVRQGAEDVVQAFVEIEVLERGRLEALRGLPWPVIREELRRFIVQRYRDGSRAETLWRWRGHLRQRVQEALIKDARFCHLPAPSRRWALAPDVARATTPAPRRLALELERWPDRELPSLVRGDALCEFLWEALSQQDAQELCALVESAWLALTPAPDQLIEPLRTSTPPELRGAHHDERLARSAARLVDQLGEREQRIMRAFLDADTHNIRALARALDLPSSTLHDALKREGALMTTLRDFAEDESIAEDDLIYLVEHLRLALDR